MKLTANSKIDRTIIFLVTTILIGIGVMYFFTNRIVNDRKQIDATKLNIESEYLRRERYQELFTTYQDISKDGILPQIKNVLPSGDNILAVVEELESISKLSNNQIIMKLGETRLTSAGFEVDTRTVTNKSTVGSTSPDAAHYDFIEIEATLRGNYDGLEQFLNLFKQAKYYMNITSMNINRVTTAKVTSVDTSMTIQIFVQKVIYTKS